MMENIQSNQRVVRDAFATGSPGGSVFGEYIQANWFESEEDNDMSIVSWKDLAVFAGGLLFGTAGVSVLASDDAKKVYTQATAAALRGRECVQTTAQNIRENCEDIYSDAVEINEERAAKKNAAEAVIEDAAEA